MLNSSFLSKGSSLIELMIAMSLGISALSAFSAFIGFGVGVNASLLTSSRLNEEFTLVSQMLARDIARAGFHAGASAQIIDPMNALNPFADPLTLSQFTNEIEDSCILFAYDRNANGVMDTQDGNENYGYRLRGKAIEMRTAGAQCDSNGWHDVTDSNVVQVTRLHFTLTEFIVGQRVLTQVEMNLVANLKAQPDVSRQSTIRFLVNNDAQ
ncbi:prepilin cleavage protein [Paraglaciecola mesophila]|uniref:Prepilin cleavage protein n=1 Tax=Paraglaciecola mesophila TaxID=197222 RepID=A0ABU9ST29_9ALTE